MLLPQYIDNLGKIVDATQAAYTATAQTVDIAPVVNSGPATSTTWRNHRQPSRAGQRWRGWKRQGQVGEMVGKRLEQGYTIEHITGVILPTISPGLTRSSKGRFRRRRSASRSAFASPAAQRGDLARPIRSLALGSALGFAVDAINGIANSAMPLSTARRRSTSNRWGRPGRWGGCKSRRRRQKRRLRPGCRRAARLTRFRASSSGLPSDEGCQQDADIAGRRRFCGGQRVRQPQKAAVGHHRPSTTLDGG